MFNSVILDVAIGMILIYLVLAFVCSSVNEYIAQIFQLRGKTCWNAIVAMFSPPVDPGGLVEKTMAMYKTNNKAGSSTAENVAIAFVKELYDGGILNTLRRDTKELPSFIDPKLFSTALLHYVPPVTAPAGSAPPTAPAVTPATPTVGASPAPPVASLAKLITSTDEPDIEAAVRDAPFPEAVKNAILPLAIDSNNDLEVFKTKVENLYNQVMDRATAVYTKKIKLILFLVAFFTCLVLNADSMTLINQLWSNPASRDAVAAAAKNQASSPQQANNVVPGASDSVSKLLGWTMPDATKPDDPRALPTSFLSYIGKFLGICASAFAVSLGAPFWFDLLQKLLTTKNGTDPKAKAAEGPQGVPQA